MSKEKAITWRTFKKSCFRHWVFFPTTQSWSFLPNCCYVKNSLAEMHSRDCKYAGKCPRWNRLSDVNEEK